MLTHPFLVDKLPKMKFKKICEILEEIFYTKDTYAEATIPIFDNE